MSIRKVSITLLYLVSVAVIALVVYYRSNITIYDTYVNSYILNTFDKMFPNLELKISDTIVTRDNDDYKITLSGILIQDKNGSLIGKIPKVDAVVYSRYFFSGFSVKDLIIQGPYIISFPTGKEAYSAINIKQIVSYASEYVSKAKVSNLVINKLHISEIYFDSAIQYNGNIINVNVKKDQNTSIQLEVRVANNTTISSQFSNIDLAYVGILPDECDVVVSGHSIFTLGRQDNISSGNIRISDITGEVSGNQKIKTIVSGSGSAEIKNSILEIENITISTKEKDIFFSGDYSLNNNSMNIHVQTDTVQIEEVLEYWPKNIGDTSRVWLENHVKGGEFINPKITIKGSVEDKLNVDVDSDFVHGKLIVEELFAPIVKMSGHLSIQNSILNIECNRAKLNEIELSNGVITKQGITSFNPLVIHGNSRSKLKELYPFLSNNYVKDIISEVDGVANVDFSFEVNDIFNRDLKITLFAVHDNNFLSVFNIQNGAFNMSINNDNWKLYGSALANNKKFKLKIDSDLEVTKANLNGKIAVSNLVDLGFIGIQSISGDVDVDINTSYVDDYQYIDGEVNISDTIIDMRSIGWHSEVGDAGSLKFNAIKKGTSLVTPKFAINSHNVEISGMGNIEDGVITHLVFNEVSVDDNHIQLSYENKGGIKHVILKGDRLVVGKLGGDNFDIDENLDITASVGEVILKNDISVFNLNVKVNPKYTNSYITGKFSSDEGFIMENNKDGLTVHSDSAGLLLSAFGITDGIDQGTLLLQSSNNSGTLMLKNFFLVKAPLLTKILSLASLQGIVNTLNNDGIYFDQLLAPFTYHDDVATFDESWLEGLSLGISFEGPVNIKSKKLDLSGYVVPIYYINKLIWQTPLIGELLTGGRGRGVISVDYKLQTQEDGESKVSVDMISILTPKILQRVLEVFKYH